MIKALVEWRYEQVVQLRYDGVSGAGTRQGRQLVESAPQHLLLRLSQLSEEARATAALATAFCKVGIRGGDESSASGVQQSRALTLLHLHGYAYMPVCGDQVSTC